MHLRSHVEQRRRSAARTRSWGGWFVGTKTKTEKGTDIFIAEVLAFGERAPGITGNLNFCAVGRIYREGMFIGRQTGKWVCRACRKQVYGNVSGRRLFQTSALQWQNVEGVPPGVIHRARKMALLHRELEQKAAEITEYTTESVQLYRRISELAQVATNLKEFEDAQKVCSPEDARLIPEHRRPRPNNIVKYRQGDVISRKRRITTNHIRTRNSQR
jgi:hypothetical protein